MPTAPYALVRASIAGGANQTGGITATGGQTCQLSADPAGLNGATQKLWELLDYPPGFALPAGWSADAQTPPIYFYVGDTPPVFTFDANSARWGKYTPRLTLNGGGPGQNGKETAAQLEAIRALTDTSCAIKVLSPNGQHDIAFGESTQFGGRLGWIGDIKKTLRVIEVLLGGGGGGTLSHSALTNLSADDHTQYLRTDGTRALTGDQSMGTHKITALQSGTASDHAINKGQLDAAIAGATGGHGIKSQGGATLTQRATLNFAAPFQASDNAGATRTDVDLLLDGSSLAKSGTGLKIAAAGVVAAMLAASAVDLGTGVITGQLPLASITDLAGLSVLGRDGSVSGTMAAITAGTTGHVLRRSGASIGFGTLVDAGVDSAAAIAGTKISPDFGSQQVKTTGSIFASGTAWFGVGEAAGSGTGAHRSMASAGDIRLPRGGATIVGRNDGDTANIYIVNYSSNVGGVPQIDFGDPVGPSTGIVRVLGNNAGQLRAGTNPVLLWGLSACSIQAASINRLRTDATGLGLYTATPIAQQTRPGQLTDSTTGTATGTIADVGGSFSQPGLNNIHASLLAKINSMEAKLSQAAGGLGAWA